MSVLVVGGGITGLVAARELARQGVPALLVEASPRLGGKIATERVGGFTVEHGPDSFLATRPAGVALARDLGLGPELTGTTEPRVVFIRHERRLVPMPEGLGLVLPTRALPFARTALFSVREKARMAADLAMPRTLGPGDVAVGAFLRHRLGDALVERLAGPLVGGVYGTPIDELSLDAVVPQLRAAEAGHRSLLFAGLADGRAMRRAAAARAKASDGSRPLGAFVSLRGGMDRLVDALAAALEVDPCVGVRTGLEVRSLSRHGECVVARFSDGSSGRFDGAIVTTPAPAAAAVMRHELPAAARILGTEIRHGTSLLVTLAYPRDALADPLVGHGYLVPETEGGAIAACTWSSEKWPGRAPADAVLLRAFVRDTPRWSAMPEAEAVTLARGDVERTLGIGVPPVLASVHRQVGAMPRYTVGHLDRLAAIDAAMADWPAVTLAGASYRGVGIPDCVAQATAAAARTVDRLLARHAEPASQEIGPDTLDELVRLEAEAVA